MYKVEVKSVAGWTLHSEHQSYRDAVDQADMVHGIVITPGGCSDEQAWRWACQNQGYDGTFADWQSLDNDERAEFEMGAAGIPTGGGA